MSRLLCRLLGHRDAPARRTAAPPGRAWWEQCDATESRGMGCTRCGQYVEHPWVNDARQVTGREP